MKLGIHVSTSGGVSNAVDRAYELGCNTFQIFVSNPRGWKSSPLYEEEAYKFREKYIHAKMEQAVSHSIYLINLASSNDFFRKQSIASLIANLEISDKLGLSGLVTHIGSYKDDTYEIGINRVVDCLKEILDKTSAKPYLLLENTAGAGSLVGDKFGEIAEIIEKVGSKRIGFCLDTAHAFESGYDLRTSEGLSEMVRLIDTNIGLENLRAVHLNDSKTALDSHHDRHEEFGEGEIGLSAMTGIINHPSFQNKPFIMETPKLKAGEAGKEFIDKVRSLQKD